MAIFNSYVSHNQRVTSISEPDLFGPRTPGGALPSLAAGAPRPALRDAAEDSTDGDPRSGPGREVTQSAPMENRDRYSGS